MSTQTLIIIAHSGLEKRITEKECTDAIGKVEHNILFIDFEITKAKLSELYSLPYEQLALEQHRRFKSEIEPILQQHPNSIIAYFGVAPIPLAFQLGVLLNDLQEFWFFQFHHDKKVWYRNISSPLNYQFKVLPVELPVKTEKGKGEVFIRVGTSYRIEPQHTLEVLPTPTNEFDLTLQTPHVDGISTETEFNDVLNNFQNVISSYANFLPDRDKIHLFIASTTPLAFALGTKINLNVCPFVQTYQFSRDETPKYKEAILVSKKMDVAVVITEDDKLAADATRKLWADQLANNVRSFIKSNEGVFNGWFSHIIQNNDNLKSLLYGSWEKLPDLGKTSLQTDKIDLKATTVPNGFSYDNSELSWKIDDGMLISLNKRFEKQGEMDISRAGRLFLFHEGLHYCDEGHRLIEEIANGIGRFPKVIEEADYQADVWALLYEYKYSSQFHLAEVEASLKKFFLSCIDTAVETMWSFVDNGNELSEIQIRSMNRFLNWYWQWVRIEKIPGTGTIEEIIKILFDKPVIEFAGAEVITIDKQRTCFKLNSKPHTSYELAIFYKNKVSRYAPTRITTLVQGFRELNGTKIKEGLKSFIASL